MKGRVTTGVAEKVQSLCSGKDWADGRKRGAPKAGAEEWGSQRGDAQEGALHAKHRGRPWTGSRKGSDLITAGIVALGLWGHEPSPEAPARCIFQCDLDFQLPQKH